MQKLENVLKELKVVFEHHIVKEFNSDGYVCEYSLNPWHTWIDIENVIRKHMNVDWIPVEEPPKKDYTAVLAVDKHDYYFVAVYDKEHGYRTNDVGADVDNIVAYCLFNPYRPERREEHDRK